MKIQVFVFSLTDQNFVEDGWEHLFEAAGCLLGISDRFDWPAP
jgi:hypothetical protein